MHKARSFFYLAIAKSVFVFLIVSMSISPAYSQNKDTFSGFKRYSDPKGYFEIQIPSDWKIQRYPNDSRGKVKFIAPRSSGVSVLVIAKKTNFRNLSEILEDVRRSTERMARKYANAGGRGGQEIEDWFGQMAVGYFFNLNSVQQKGVYFLFGNQEYNLSYVAPNQLVEQFKLPAQTIMRSIEPILVSGGPSANQQTAESKYRLAQLALSRRSKDWAILYVKEGLGYDSTNTKLLKMARELSIK